MTKAIDGRKIFVDLQITGEIRSPDTLRDVAFNIRHYFMSSDSTFDGPRGLAVIAQGINADAGHGNSIQVQGEIDAKLVGLSDLHEACAAGNLSYQIMEAEVGQEGYSAIRSWEPDYEKQTYVHVVGETDPAMSLADLKQALDAGTSLAEICAVLEQEATVAMRGGAIVMDETVFLQLQEELTAEALEQERDFGLAVSKSAA